MNEKKETLVAIPAEWLKPGAVVPCFPETVEVLLAALKASTFTQGRAAGLEEAAKACQQRAMNHASEVREDEADACADAIRALAPTSSDAGKDDALELDAKRYQLLRRGQKWSFIDGIGNTLRGEELDAAIDAAIAAQGDGK